MQSERKKSQKRQSTTAYFGDRKFLPRVREYVENNHGLSTTEDVLEYLQSTFMEYGRKKQNVLRMSVLKAMDVIRLLQTDSSYLERKHLAKRSKQSNKEKELSSQDEECDDVIDDEFSLNGEMLTEYKDTNALNTSMQSLYKSTVPSPKRDTTPVQDKLFRIDKKPSSEKQVSVPNSHNIEECEGSQSLGNVVEKSSCSTGIQIRSVCASEEDQSTTPANVRLKSSTSKRTTLKKEKKYQPISSDVTFKDIGGYESCLESVSKLLLHLKHPEVFLQLGIKPPCGFLIHGLPGCGKTLLANAIAGELQLPFFKIAATEVVSGISGESEQKIRELFNEAVLAAPSVLFIDEVDSITPKRDSAGKESERRVVTQILTCMDELANGDTNVLVIGATNRADTIDPALRRAGRFDREIAMGIPSKEARKRILKVICRDMRLEPGFDFDLIANRTPGFVGADVQSLAREAAMCAVESAFKCDEQIVNRTLFQGTTETDCAKSNAMFWLHEDTPFSEERLLKLYLTTKHFEEALMHVQPSSKREGFATVPDVTWSDIGALEDVREELKMSIMAPVRNPEEFESLGLTTPPGILLAGPPGCGKTLLAKAIANEAGINFISVKGPELLNMYVGESEKAVRQVFQRARNSSPCVIFFDEIDALCPKRSETGDSSASARVVNQLLTEMDGLETRKHVYVMGATNRPDILDAAILRPGRLDKFLFVGLPTIHDRVKILNTITKNGGKPPLDGDITVETIAADQRCEGYSGADLSALVREASVVALKEYMNRRDKVISEATADTVMARTETVADDDKGRCKTKILVNRRHFELAFEKVIASVSGADREWYEEVKKRHMRRK